MRHIICPGPRPHDIGLQHGSAAAVEIQRSIAFYKDLFRRTAGLGWEDVINLAKRFDECHAGSEERRGRGRWGEWREEMNGIAEGAGVPYDAILALNVRTEVAYGMARDGCTALSWKTSSGASFLAQNWDWQEEQRQNLIHLHIQRRLQDGKPAISMITEAGIIGKIGLNERGVGVCLNAIGALGVDFAKIPVHLALRACLESNSADEAVGILRECGVAAACHILVMDESGGVGLECSSKDVVLLLPDAHGLVRHTNHFLERHEGVEDKVTLKDSPLRLNRLDELLQQKIGSEGPDGQIVANDVLSMLKDEVNFPTAICRSPTKDSTTTTLFNIVMDLKKREASVIVGRPSQIGAERIRLDPKNESQ